jgi:hypothetical protein
MYAWIWRHLPFGRPGRIVGSVLGVLGVTALLWFAVFPAVEPHLWFSDVQISEGNTPAPAAPPGGAPSADPSDFVVPYSTLSNAPHPSASGR